MTKKNKQAKSDHEPSDDESSAGKECTLCHDVPERIIYLSCDHIICLVCATKLIISESDEKDIDFSEVKCGVCGESTALSKEVQETLLEFLNSGDFQLNSEDEDDEEDDENEEEEKNDSAIKNIGSKQKDKKNLYNQNDDDDNEDQEDNDEDNDKDKDESKEEFSSNFGCQIHDGEEYAYYNPNTRVLFCTQCLLASKLQQNDLSGFKSLKKCFPEILQGFQDMIKEVEVCRNLLDNKRKDFDIRKDNARSQCQSYIRKFELAVEELIDNLQEQKTRLSQILETKLEETLNNEEEQENSIETRVEYFNAIIDQIGGFKQGDNPEEEIFGFFFANQEKIYTALQEEKTHKNDDRQPFRDFENTIKIEHDNTLNEFYKQTIDKVQNVAEQFKPKKQMHVPVLYTEETKGSPDAIFAHFIQKIRQQSASFKGKSVNYEHENPLSKSKFNWQERQSKEKTNNNFFNKTMDKGTVQKLDIEKKLKLLDFRNRKEDYIQSVNTVTNFRKGKDGITNKLEQLKQQLRSRPTQPQFSVSYKLK